MKVSIEDHDSVPSTQANVHVEKAESTRTHQVTLSADPTALMKKLFKKHLPVLRQLRKLRGCHTCK